MLTDQREDLMHKERHGLNIRVVVHPPEKGNDRGIVGNRALCEVSSVHTVRDDGEGNPDLELSKLDRLPLRREGAVVRMACKMAFVRAKLPGFECVAERQREGSVAGIVKPLRGI